MRACSLTTAFLACLVCASGQSAAPVALTVVQGASGPTTSAVTDTSAAAHPAWRAANTGAATITAFAVTYTLPLPAGLHVSNATAERIYDAATEPLSAKPIPPGQSMTLPFAPPDNLVQAAPQIQAVLFSDGKSWGDPNWVKRISNRRTYMAQSLQAALSELSVASANATTRDVLIAQFQSGMAAEQKAAADKDQQACIVSVRGIVLRNLQTVNRAGVPVPLKTVLEHEIGALTTRLTAVQAAGH